MATAIDTLLGNAGLRARLGEAGRRRIARVFSWDGMAEQYGRIFEEVAGERAA
jgi:glycosyltransferase involved in cell wall biosynthesis